MKIVTTFHQGSSVLSSVRCQLSTRDLEHLVVAKSNRLEVYSLRPYGLQHESSLEFWGKVLCVKSVPISNSSRSNIIVMLAHPDPELIFLAYSESETGSGALKVNKQLSLYERTPRQAEFFNDLLVHPSGKVAIVSCYTGKLKVVTLKVGNYAEDFDVSLPELNVLALAFLPLQENDYTLAILHLDYEERVQLLARDLLLEDLELSSQPSTLLHPTPISAKHLPLPTDTAIHLIPVPPSDQSGTEEEEADFLGGVLVVGGRKVIIYELANVEKQTKQRNKRRRLEARKQSEDTSEYEKATEKEKEREGRRRKPKASVDWPWSEVTAHCTLDRSRFLLGDSFGRLALLSTDHLKRHGLIMLPLGEISPPTTLSYLTSQVLYVGSHLGDSQLVQISTSPTSHISSSTLPVPASIRTVSVSKLTDGSLKKGKGKAISSDEGTDGDSVSGAIVETNGSYVNVIETFKNIAPILDAVLADTDGSGQRQIVTCSGGGNRGSINVVRNGADFQDFASVPGLAGVTNVWSLRRRFEDTTDSYIFISTLQSSQLLKIDDTGVSLAHVQCTGVNSFISDSRTFAVGNVALRIVQPNGKASYGDSQLVVQVTPKGVFLLEFNDSLASYERIAEWVQPGSEIVAASINPSQVALALNKGELVVLSVTGTKDFRVLNRGVPGEYAEISAVSCAPLDPTRYFSNYITVSYWETNVVEVLMIDAKGLVSVSKSEPLPALVRSVMLYNFGSDKNSKGEDYSPHVVAGLGDGSVVYFSWKEKQLKDKKIVSLGSSPVSLTVCQVEDKRTIFAAGNRATVFSWEKKRLHNSPIMLKEITGASRLDTRRFPSCIVLAAPTGLFIGRVRDLDKMHIRSIPLGLENPQRIAYQPNLKVFGVACTRTDPARVGDVASTQSSFKIFDDATFNQLDSYQCDVEEVITAVTALSAEVHGKSAPLFCIGAFTYDEEEVEPTNGRLLLLTANNNEAKPGSSELQLLLLASTEVRGCVYSLALVNDMIVAAVNSSIQLYRIQSEEDVLSPAVSLSMVAEWNHNYLVTSLATYGDHVVAGDQISSVSLLKISGTKITNIARDYGPLWPLCVEASDEENIIGANDASNLFTFRLSQTLGRPFLERNGSYHLAELVTKFIRGSITDVEQTSPLQPKHLFFTTSGRIGVIVDVTDDRLSLHLTELQRNLGGTMPAVGGVSHARYRAPRNTRGRSDADAASFGFLDGDFVEQFLACLGSPEQLEKIMAGHSEPERLTSPAEEIQKVLENLQSMH